MGPCENVV